MGKDCDFNQFAGDAIDATSKLRKILYNSENRDLIGAVVDLNRGGDAQFIVMRAAGKLENISMVVYEEEPEKYVWERGCLLRCELPIKLPLYYPLHDPKGKF